MGYSSLALSGFGRYTDEIPNSVLYGNLFGGGTPPDVYGQYLKKNHKQKINKPKRKKRRK